MVVALVAVPLVIHSLGVVGFGLWGAATSLAWAAGMLDLGFGGALVTLIPQALTSDQPESARRYVAAALYGGAAVGAILLGCGLAWLSLVAHGHIEGPLFVAGTALALNIPLSMASPVWLGLQKGYVGSGWELAQSLLTLGLLGACAACGANVATFVAAVYGAMLLANAGSLLHLLVTHPELRPRGLPDGSSLRTTLARGGMMFGITVAASSAYVFDNVMALAWLGPEASARMAVVMRICTTATGMLAVISQPFWPAFAAAAAAHDRVWMRRTLRNGSFALAGLSTLGGAVLVAFGSPILHLWLHRDLGLSPGLLVTMAAWIIITTLPHMPGLLLQSLVRLRPQLLILAAIAISGVFLKAIAAKAFGVIGILVVLPLQVLFLLLPASFWLAWRAIDALDAPVKAAPAP